MPPRPAPIESQLHGEYLLHINPPITESDWPAVTDTVDEPCSPSMCASDVTEYHSVKTGQGGIGLTRDAQRRSLDVRTASLLGMS
jgi:hypothetical protein